MYSTHGFYFNFPITDSPGMESNQNNQKKKASFVFMLLKPTDVETKNQGTGEGKKVKSDLFNIQVYLRDDSTHSFYDLKLNWLKKISSKSSPPQ